MQGPFGGLCAVEVGLCKAYTSFIMLSMGGWRREGACFVGFRQTGALESSRLLSAVCHMLNHYFQGSNCTTKLPRPRPPFSS